MLAFHRENKIREERKRPKTMLGISVNQPEGVSVRQGVVFRTNTPDGACLIKVKDIS